MKKSGLIPKSKYYTNNPNNMDFFNYVYACHSTLLNGSIDSKDGSRFRGRGFIQLTGYENYKKFQNKWNSIRGKDNPKDFICRSKECDENLEELNTNTETGMLAAMVFWKSADTNSFADKGFDKAVVDDVTLNVNGALHGIDDRRKYTKNAYEILSDENN